MDKRLKRILPRVQKPARYTGGEYNQILKDPSSVDLRLAFCFPDTYEIGMSNLGMSILYHTMNSLPRDETGGDPSVCAGERGSAFRFRFHCFLHRL